MGPLWLDFDRARWISARAASALRDPQRQLDRHPFRGEYREIVPPEQLVYTFMYDVDGFRDPGGLVQDALPGRESAAPRWSRRCTSRRSTRGMKPSIPAWWPVPRETLDRLAELLATLVKKMEAVLSFR